MYDLQIPTEFWSILTKSGVKNNIILYILSPYVDVCLLVNRVVLEFLPFPKQLDGCVKHRIAFE